jgi:hypothetical protein
MDRGHFELLWIEAILPAAMDRGHFDPMDRGHFAFHERVHFARRLRATSR